MAFPSHRTENASKNTRMRVNEKDIKQWIKRVEAASDLAVAEVFSSRKSRERETGMKLKSLAQLQDHDDTFAEAQSVLSEWMKQTLCLDLETEDEELYEETCSRKMNNLVDIPFETLASCYDNFEDMHSHLQQELEGSAVDSFLQGLMETEVSKSASVEDFITDTKTLWRDPMVTMEARHKQVKENRLRRDAEQNKMHQEKEVRREAREEAWKQEQEKQRKKRQRKLRDEELIQQDMIRLRREMQEKRSVEQLARNMEKQRLQEQRSIEKSLILRAQRSNMENMTKDLQLNENNHEANLDVLNLQCKQKHFSAWYSLVLERKLQTGKATALCDWRRRLKAWRAWRALVWTRRERKESEEMEEELRQEHRRNLQAMESDRRRRLSRCLGDWRSWCRLERHRRELLKQQEETSPKIAALINAVASGKPAEGSSTSFMSNSSLQIHSLTEDDSNQVTRRCSPLSEAELRQARQSRSHRKWRQEASADPSGEGFKRRHVALQQAVAEQKLLLESQQKQILHLQERQNQMEERHVEEKGLMLVAGHPEDPGANGSSEPHGAESAGKTSNRTESVKRQTSTHPAVQAMEERARQRSERRRLIEEKKKQREEEKLAEMEAAEDERLKIEEEEKRKARERKKEEMRLQRKKELEMQRRREREQELGKVADQHYLRKLMLQQGLAPWKRLREQSHLYTERAVDHYAQTLQRRSFWFWRQTANKAEAKRESSAEQRHQHILLQGAWRSWIKMKDLRLIEEARADEFYRRRAQRKVFWTVMEQRAVAWDKRQRAEQHHSRKAIRRCFACWKRHPVVSRQEREIEKHRERLRQKVAEILPDFRASLQCSINPL